MILAIETSTPVCSVALAKNRHSVVEKRIEGHGVHSERTFTFIRELLNRHNVGISGLDAVLFSNGPGSYTGLRIGASALKGLLFQRDVPLYTLPTLLGFAVPYLGSAPAQVHAVIDARREHLYHQKAEILTGGELTVTEARVRKLSDLEDEIEEHHMVVGTGWSRLGTGVRKGENWAGSEAISANSLILGWHSPLIRPYFKKEDPESFEPNYLTMSQVNNSAV